MKYYLAYNGLEKNSLLGEFRIKSLLEQSRFMVNFLTYLLTCVLNGVFKLQI